MTGFGYDALRRRVSRTASGTTTSTQYAGGAPVTETQGSTFTAAYTLGTDLLRRNGEYPAFEAPGSARAETNSSGTATATQDFDAFGNTIASSGSTSSPYNFAGDWAYQSNGDAGLLHVGARYYDPQVGRFASRDSMLDQIPYVYCGGDPVDWADPTGHFRPTNAELGAIIVGVGGAIIGTVVGIIAAGPVGGIEGGIEGAKTGIAVGAWIGGTVGAGLGGYVGAREDGDNQADALTEGGIAMIGVGLTGMCPALAALWLAK